MRWLALLLLLGPLPVLAETATDTLGRFAITWPEEWTPGTDSAYVEAFPPATWPPGVNCIAEMRSEPALLGMGQGALNEMLTQVVALGDWQALMGAPELRAVADQIVVPGDLVGRRASVTLNGPRGTVLQARVALFLRPGEVYLAACLAAERDFAGIVAALDSILATFRPLPR